MELSSPCDSSSKFWCKQTHDHPRNPLRHPKHRSHEGHKEDQEEQQQWLEDIKNLCVVVIEWMDEALDKINPRVTNPREILGNKMTNECHRHGMMETMFPPIDIHEETPLELKKEDDIDKHGSYLETPHQIHAHIRNFLNQLVSSTLPYTRFSTPSYFLFIKTLKGWLYMHMFIINIADLVV